MESTLPFYYDVNRAETSSGSAGTEAYHFYAATVANQETAALKGIFIASRFGTAGGAQYRVKTNTGTAASGGSSQTPAKRNLRGNPSAQTTWFNDGSAITNGGTLTTRLTIGFAQTGGMGGWVPVEAPDAIVMMPNATNPVDTEFTSIASSASVTFDVTHEFSEGY
jgi:hypothetical protein